MKSVIICEGNTDLTLIQYFLEKTDGWVYIDKSRYKAHEDMIHKNDNAKQVKWFKHPNGAFLSIMSAAKFETTFVVMTPADAFGQRQSLLRSIPWEQYELIQSTFKHLRRLSEK